MADVAGIAGLDPDTVSTFILEGVYENRMLAGVIGATKEDLRGKTGDTVQVPIMGARTAQGPIAAGDPLTATDSTFTTAPIVLAKHGDYEKVQNEVWEDQDSYDIAAFLRAQSEALAERMDLDVYAALDGATPGSSTLLATAGDLTTDDDYYVKLVDLFAAMRKAKRVPTHVIHGPDQDASLRKLASEGVVDRSVTLTADGKFVATVAGIPCIVTANANANTATLNQVQAVVIHQPRAIGEALGRPPNVVVDETTDAPTDETRLITWMRWNTAVLEEASIGHVLNPAA